MKKLLIIISASIFMLSAHSSNAAIISFEATIDGDQTNSGLGNASPGTGFATMSLDDVSNVFSWNISWMNLSSPATGMHFHLAPPDDKGPVQLNFGAISGLTSPSIGSAVITEANKSDLLAELWYINIHTTDSFTEEIRGQVNIVPVPAAVWLFSSGLLGLIAASKRNKRT